MKYNILHKTKVIISLLKLIGICFFLQNNIYAQQSVKPKVVTHQDIFLEKMKLPKPKTMAQEVIHFGLSFLSKAYPKSRIDTTRRADGSVKLQPISQEVLVVNLKMFDCVTFVEHMISLAQSHRKNDMSFDNFKNNLRWIRYRNGVVDYATKMHYFSDWLYEHEKRGILKQITKDLGGEVYNKKVFYMSLKKDTMYGNMVDPRTYKDMLAVEKAITEREKIYIPKDKVASIQHLIKTGDIIGITNRTEGMDMAHAGIAIWSEGELKMIHASSQFKKVVITEGSLAEYLKRNKMQTGIMVARLID